MTTIEELRTQGDEIAASPSGMIPYTPSGLLERAASEIEALQKENADLRKQLAELTVKKTQVYNPPKPSIGNFSS